MKFDVPRVPLFSRHGFALTNESQDIWLDRHGAVDRADPLNFGPVGSTV